MVANLSRMLSGAAEAIEVIGAGNPRFEAELLLSHVLKKPRVFLFTHPEYLPSEDERRLFQTLLDRRLSSEPLQYVLGTAAFRHLMLLVRPGVLIPRSETELLVDKAWEALQGWADARFGPGGAPLGGRPPDPDAAGVARPWVIDVGVGSGAILLALVYEAVWGSVNANAGGRGGQARPAGPDREVRDAETADPGWGTGLWFHPLGIDISPVPLSLTSENAALNRLPRPHLLLADYLSALDSGAPVAGIVSNPPYISTPEMADLPTEIREHEPHEALYGGADGLGAIRILIDQSLPFIRRGSFLCFEIGGTQGQAVRGELARLDLLDSATIFSDLAGRPRVVLVNPGR